MCVCRGQAERHGLINANRRRSGKAAGFYSESTQFGSKPQRLMFCRTARFSQAPVRNFVGITSVMPQLTSFEFVFHQSFYGRRYVV
jgi:hypothetical protein